MNVKEIVTDLCKNKGISRSKMEKDLGLGNGTSGKWNNSIPNPIILKKLAEYFNVSTEYLLTGKDPVVDFIYSDDNVDFLVEIQKKAHNKDFVNRIRKYMDLMDSDRKSVDDMIDFMYEKNKKEVD